MDGSRSALEMRSKARDDAMTDDATRDDAMNSMLERAGPPTMRADFGPCPQDRDGRAAWELANAIACGEYARDSEADRAERAGVFEPARDAEDGLHSARDRGDV